MQFNFQFYDLQAFAQSEKQSAKLRKIYNDVLNEVSRLTATLNIGELDVFSFAKYPRIKAKIDALFLKMGKDVQIVINDGTAASWAMANAKNDNFLEYIGKKFNIPKSELAKKYSFGGRNNAALESFQKRKDKGLNLSDRVWNYSKQYKSEIENAIDVSFKEGNSAQNLSKSVREYLNDPDKLFRRIRDKRGALIPSKAMKAYHPGQGVYRSSYKNAMRLSRTEINMAYRQADFDRWNGLDFVLGIEVRLSNNPNHCPTCIALAGIYPKGFVFVGFHPQCRCYAVPQLPSDKDFTKSLLDESFELKGQVTKLPPNATQWFSNNKDSILRAKNLPYFIRDNKEFYKI